MFRASIGGLRHVATEPGKIDQACGEVRNLSNEEVNQVLDFIAELKASREPQPERLRTGAAEALLLHTNRWSFNEGERESLMERIRRIREGEAL